MPTTIVDCGSRSTGVVESLIYFRLIGSEVSLESFASEVNREMKDREGRGTREQSIGEPRLWCLCHGQENGQEVAADKNRGGAGAINDAKEIGEGDGLSS
ncbi:hypothetical protein NL676_006481 [Syzygium grande]|nr:hypothetical protein NL676_006481 [Syzygium grande]